MVSLIHMGEKRYQCRLGRVLTTKKKLDSEGVIRDLGMINPFGRAVGRRVADAEIQIRNCKDCQRVDGGTCVPLCVVTSAPVAVQNKFFQPFLTPILV